MLDQGKSHNSTAGDFFEPFRYEENLSSDRDASSDLEVWSELLTPPELASNLLAAAIIELSVSQKLSAELLSHIRAWEYGVDDLMLTGLQWAEASGDGLFDKDQVVAVWNLLYATV